MTPNRKLLLASIASAALLTSGGLAVQRTFAAESTDTSPITSLVEKIASKFNLNKDEVQAVFDTDKEEHKTAMEAKMKERQEEELTNAVEDGEITQAQKDLITTKMTEVKTKMDEVEAIQNDGDRRAAVDQLRADLSKWAADNDIDARYLHLGFGPGKHEGFGGRPGRGFGGPHEMGTSSSDTSSSTTAN